MERLCIGVVGGMLLQGLHEILARIPLDHELIREDIEYFKQLVMRYVRFRLPDLGRYSKSPANGSTVQEARAS